MAVGSVVSAFSTAVGNNNYLAIQPPAGQEWVIHNIHHSGAAELYFTDGVNPANDVLVATDSNQGSWLGLFLHVTNTLYYRIKNVAGAAATLGYDGIRTT